MAGKKQPIPHPDKLRKQIEDFIENLYKGMTPLQIIATKCIDPNDVAAVFKVHLNTLYNWDAANLLPISKIKRRHYIDLADVIIMLANGKKLPESIEDVGR